MWQYHHSPHPASPVRGGGGNSENGRPIHEEKNLGTSHLEGARKYYWEEFLSNVKVVVAGLAC